ncbi:MAG: XdhC family protein [bacterium]|nr:XdhC family protein [bacterium]
MPEIYEDILNLKKKGAEGVVITVVGKEGHGPAGIGTKMLVRADGTKSGTVGGGALEYAAIKKAGQVMKSKESRLKKYILSTDNDIIDAEKTGMLCGGNITLFFEYVGSGVWLYIFGAGHIGKSLAFYLKDLNYYITMIDSREGMVNTIEGVHRPMTAKYETALENAEVPQDSFFIIATHSHAMDYTILKRIYQSHWRPKYIGLIASRKKSVEMIDRLHEELGQDINLNQLYSPMGLNIGGQLPNEIAISIISELQAVRYNKEGHKHMRNK